MTTGTVVEHGRYDHTWVNGQPCVCGDTGPADVFAFLGSSHGQAWKAETDPATYFAQTDGDTSPIPTPEPQPDDVPDGDIGASEPVDDDGSTPVEEDA